MMSIISLPYDVLEDVFSSLNQHQALEFAPLHSELQNVIKKKLYNTIPVYRVGDPQTVKGEESKEEWHYFRYLKQLYICGFISPSNEFTISKMVNTSKLEELYIQGSLGPNIQGMFSPSGLDVEYPCLIQLGIDSDSCNLRRLVQILSSRTHNKPQSLIIVHQRKSWKSYIPQLCVRFPNASINWWHLRECPTTSKSFLDTASIFSPNLPQGVVGYHHYDEASKWISKRVFPCELYGNKRMDIELQKWSSNSDLDMISCDPLNPHDVHSEECKL